MNMKKIAALLASVVLLSSVTACSDDPSDGSDETFRQETLPKETYTVVEGASVKLNDGLPTSAYSAESTVGVWLAGCNHPNRDEQFDAYVLRHESTSGENTVFTYLIYYPHGGDPLSVTPELTENGDSYLMNIRYDSGKGEQGYSLCRLEVSLPTQNAPRLRFRVGEEILDVLVTVTDMATL